MNINITIKYPENEIGFIENKRSFVVEGTINSDCEIPNNVLLGIYLYNSNNEIVRKVYCDKKNKDMFLNYPNLITYSDEIDRNKEGLKKFGFPALVVNDVNNPYDSLNNGSIKAWYSDDVFKAIIINASNKENGALADDGFNFIDENGNSYKSLPIGKYVIEVKLEHNNEVLAIDKKEIEIGKRKKQFICRFNPESHKERMIKWCKENDISIITELIPGYLDSYLGNWEYHKGLLKMYRANDLCLFDDVDVILFNYLIDSTSTSYETELAYLQSKNFISNNNRFSVYYYENGEAILGKNKAYERISKINKFNNNEFGIFYRVDELLKKSEENVFNLDEKNIKNMYFDLHKINSKNNIFAITGVVKPIQLDPSDFILRDDNTYDILDYPNIIRYFICIDDKQIIEDRHLNMERIDGKFIGKSVYEFYNIFEFKEFESISIKAECIYSKGTTVQISNIINIERI